MNANRRKHERYRIDGLKSSVSDGSSAFLVAVEDLSEKGVGLNDVPSDFDVNVKKCLAVINTPHRDFRLDLNPRWVQISEEGKHKKIGFEIENPSSEWIEFVASLTSNPDNNRKEHGKRIKSMGLMTILSDGQSSYFGVVEEISEKGLRLAQVPTGFDETKGECKAVLLSPSGDLKISLLPCWAKSTKRGMYKSVGFQIKNPPADWQGFIRNMESEAGDYSFFLLKEEAEE